MKKALDIIQLIITILLIIFGLFILYQIILKISGGSWGKEDIIISMLIFSIGLTIATALNLIKFNIDYNYFKKYMHKFVNDSKEFNKKIYNDLIDIKK